MPTEGDLGICGVERRRRLFDFKQRFDHLLAFTNTLVEAQRPLANVEFD